MSYCACCGDDDGSDLNRSSYVCMACKLDFKREEEEEKEDDET